MKKITAHEPAHDAQLTIVRLPRACASINLAKGTDMDVDVRPVSRRVLFSALIVIGSASLAFAQFPFFQRGNQRTPNDAGNKATAQAPKNTTPSTNGANRGAAQSPQRTAARTGATGAAPAKTPLAKQELAASNSHDAGEPHWIWAPSAQEGPLPPKAYFRKTLDLRDVDTARVQITADDKYELYVNGRLVGGGNDWHLMQTFDVTRMLSQGRNTIAIKAENTQGTTAAVVARVIVRPKGSTDLVFATDATWKVATQVSPGWEHTGVNDSKWAAARSFGELGSTAPWGEQVKANDGSQTRRFQVTRNFRIERVIHPNLTGSLISMAFNEWGEILVARERGPLLICLDRNKDGLIESVDTYCDQVVNCQGILPLNGQVFVVADGPQGAALYRLADANGDGKADDLKAIVKFDPGISEHGPHAVTLGPDGLLYVMVGNHSAAQPVTLAAKGEVPTNDTPKVDESVKPAAAEEDGKPAATALGPYHHPYEGDLLTPKYEDANGHAVGIKAPCGTIVRTDADGSFVQLFAGGLRNAYDMAFDERGELFTYDSDMEWDSGLPWYRPTRIYHVPAGAEFGSRSGWSPWPEYYLDSIPGIADTGRGSPTGVETYLHHAYPPEYRHALFLGDWSQGRIIVVHPQPDGGGYRATAEVFAAGQPLNITDLAVGPDGWLYFVCGGRGSEGGIYRIVWTGKQPPEPKQSPIAQAIRQPQPHSAWGRQRIAMIQEKLGADWDRQIAAIASDTNNRLEDRLHALALMPLYGPDPDATMLAKLAKDEAPQIRAKAAWLMGLRPEPRVVNTLTSLTTDGDPLVRRLACEAIGRGHYQVTAATLLPLLGDSDRLTAWAARRALQSLPTDQWREAVLADKSAAVFLVGSAALLPLDADRDTCLAVLKRCQTLLKGFLNDDDFLALMRVIELALIQGQIAGDDVAELRTALADEYPSANHAMNRELVKLACYLQAGEVLPRLIEELNGSAPDEEKLYAAFCARFLKTGWTTEQKLAVLEFYEESRKKTGGYSYAGYIDNVGRDFASLLNEAEREGVLADGAKFPSAALNVLSGVETVSPTLVARLIDLDDEIAGRDEEPVRRLQTGIVAILAGSGQADAMDYLRRLWEKYPERRPDLAMGLAQQPDGDNWPLLIRAFPALDGAPAQEVLSQLVKSSRKSDDPEVIRQVILCGLRLGENGGLLAARLLDKWTDAPVVQANMTWDQALEKRRAWFVETYPNLPAPVLPTEHEGSRWTYQELLVWLESDDSRSGDASRGMAVFEKANCHKCHRFAGRGETIGPDLSTVAQRFQRKEILRSLLFPSEVVSDQYAGKIVVTTTGKTFTGILGAAGADAYVVLQSNGQKVTIKKSEIDEIAPSKKSIMPEGALDQLTQDEIADLFALLLNKPGDAGAGLTRQPKPLGGK